MFVNVGKNVIVCDIMLNAVCIYVCSQDPLENEMLHLKGLSFK